MKQARLQPLNCRGNSCPKELGSEEGKKRKKNRHGLVAYGSNSNEVKIILGFRPEHIIIGKIKTVRGDHG